MFSWYAYLDSVRFEHSVCRGSLITTYSHYMENKFLKNEQIQPYIWFRYIDDIFFILAAGEKELVDFLGRLNSFHPNLKFTHGEFITNLYCKPSDDHQYFYFESCHPSHTKSSIILVRLWEWEEFFLRKVILLLMLEILRIGSMKEVSRGYGQ